MKHRLSLVFILLILILPVPLFAGTTGKISGAITDVESREPLTGVNVMIEGTAMGAVTDINGFYFILNVPPGTYSVKATIMGYEIQRQTGVRVAMDMTTRLDFKLKSTVLEGQAVTVVAERPAIQKDLTSSLQSFSNSEIVEAPVENLSQIIEIQSGINRMGSENSGYVSGAPGDGIHIRGGRENETLFLIDGIKVGDDIYGGSRYIQNTSGTTINEMKTIIGTFNAEYGGKMAGVISVVTKDGEETYSGRLSGYTDHFGIDTFDKNTYQGEATLSGPVPLVKKMVFYANGQLRTTDGRKDVYGLMIPNWSDSKGLMDRTATGEKVPALWEDDWNAMFKLTYKPIPSMKLSASYYHSWGQEGKYSHSYRYVPMGLPYRETINTAVIIKMVHTVNPRTFYEVIGSYQTTDFFYGVDKYRERKNVFGDRLTREFYYYSGAPHEYNTDSSKTWQAVLNFTSQVNKHHQLKSGVELRRLNVFHRMDMAGGSPLQKIEGEIYEKHLAYARRHPIEFSVYLQDKMEFEDIGMIMNLGGRLEYWDQRMEYMEEPDLPFSTQMLSTEKKIRISPRFGLSYPVSDQAAFHLAYGHFYQLPRYMELLSGLNDEGYYEGRPNLNDPGPGISNPNAKPEKTVSYETGLQFQLAGNSTLNVTAFYREMADLMGVRWMSGGGGYVYLDNVDFGNAKGVEMTLEKRFSNLWSARVNYTWSTVKISTSSPLTAAQKNRFIAYRTFLADWDRPHDINALLLISDPKSWGISIITRARSGRPYSVLAEELNTERMPWEIITDLRLSKYFRFLGMNQAVYLQIYNLFNRRNIRSVYSETGKWDDDGLYSTPYDLDASPTRRSEGRSARIGFKLDF
ncbi:TonB-dependent receptor [candidate division KSB1 bacterium]|nr:TonB-dependent receptor [candidate division KSB1 bacterium]